jgi:hypothetical protein
MTFVPDELTTQLLRNNEPQPIPLQNLRVKTWFLQNAKGEIVAVDEAAAWHMIQPNQNIGTYKMAYKIVGVSNANIYAKCVEDIQGIQDMEEKKRLLKQAFEEELAEARKHFEMPRNPNILDISGRPQTDPRVLANIPK